MQKGYIFIAHNGIEVIDASLEAESRVLNMDYLENRKPVQNKRAFKDIVKSFICLII